MLALRRLATLIFLAALPVPGLAPRPAWAQRAAAPAELPYRAAGLDARTAAAHLLGRFGFGARPEDVDRVAETGLGAWLDAQLDPAMADLARTDPDLARRLDAIPELALDAHTLAATFPPAGRVLTEAVAAGLVSRRGDASGGDDTAPADALRRNAPGLLAFAASRGYRPERDLRRALVGQKIVRAVTAEAQLREVLAEMWFNHFNVALQDGPARPYVLAYERDAIRPNVLGRFRDLLSATARHPAMLLYLDNAQSVAPMPQGRAMARAGGRPQRAARGVNENYARELLELHTLGADGGYTQADVENVARAFTGWSVYPARPDAAARIDRAIARGLATRDGAFVFLAAAHDRGAKSILGHHFPAGGGSDGGRGEGERVLDLLARHPATARRVARLLATRFVSDASPEALVDDLAAVYARTDGDIAAVVRALAAHPAFWAPEAIGAKVKSPFEFAVSALRATGARVVDAQGVAQAVAQMGQPLYGYSAPTGYPDRAGQWLSAGAVAVRLRTALSLADGTLPGVRLDPRRLAPALSPGASPTEAVAALAARLLPPGHAADLTALAEVAARPTEERRPMDAATAPSDEPADGSEMAIGDNQVMQTDRSAASPRRAGVAARAWRGPAPRTDALSQALGVLLGSPAFQRR